jgi:hypothetical protein
LAEDRLRFAGIGHDADLASEEAGREEDGAEERGSQHEGDLRVAGLRRLEGRHPVGDGLDAGERHRARGECPQDKQERERFGVPGVEPFGRRHVGREGPRRRAGHPHAEHAEHQHDVQRRRHGERRPRFAHSAQVQQRREREHHEADGHALRVELGKGRGQRGHAGSRRDGGSEDVVANERRCGDERGPRPQVLPRDDVAAAAVRIGAYDLEVAQRDDCQQHQDDAADRRRQRQRANASACEHAHDLFGGVRGGGEVIRREDRQPLEDANALLVLLLAGNASPNEHATRGFQGTPERTPGRERALCRHQVAALDQPELAGVRAHDAHKPIAWPRSAPHLEPGVLVGQGR